MPDSLSPSERRALLRTLKTLPRSVFAEIRIVLDVPVEILPEGAMGDRAVALIDWASSSIGCGLAMLKQEVDAIVADYKNQNDQIQNQPSQNAQNLIIQDKLTDLSSNDSSVETSLISEIQHEYLQRLLTQLRAAYQQKLRSSGVDRVRAQEDIDQLEAGIRKLQGE